ncbi:MAG: hypothetical protein ACK48Y_09260, partial [Planctomyces sp.]
ILQEAEEAEIAAPGTCLMNVLAGYPEARADMTKVQFLLRQANQVDETRYGPDDPEVAIRCPRRAAAGLPKA